MRILTFAALGVSILLLAAVTAVAQPPDEGRFELRRVMLSTGGVGYFEYETRVSGESALSFRVRRDQVDDVLKSVVVYDDEGRVGTISLPGQEPLREAFRGLPFEPDHLSSPAQLFNALRGAEVRVSGAREVVGRLLAVRPETIVLPEGASTVRHRVSLLTSSGIQQVLLEEVGSIAFTDPELSAQVETALAAIARHDDPDSRTLTVTMDGDAGERTVRVAYVVEVPLWKATYRLTLSESPTAALQGWAVLENLTGEDWREVELSVVSGNPVTFRQALYEAYYVNRPDVPVEVLGRVLPGADEGTVRGMPESAREALDAAAMSSLRAAPRAMDSVTVSGSRVDQFRTAIPAEAAMRAAESSEATTQVLFHVPQPVTIAAGDSVLVPIVSHEVPARRMSLFQPDTHPRHPLASILLSNDTGTGLPPGVLTLYERDPGGAVSYVGDARLASLPSGDERLLSFAVDQRVTVDREDQGTQRIGQGRIVDGMLEVRVMDRQASRYIVAAAPGEEREVILEHPRRAGWDLVGADDELEMTESAYRLPVTVAGGETIRFDATLERPRLQRVELTSLDLERIQVWAGTDELSADIRAALRELAELRAQVTEIERGLRAAEQTRGTVVSDQTRIRDNLGAVPQDSDLARRYLDELTRQEDRLAELRAEMEGLRETLGEAEQRLAQYVRSLSL